MLLLYRLSRYNCQYCDYDLNFLHRCIVTCMNMDKTNGKIVILVHLLMFVVDSSTQLACTPIKCFESFVTPLSVTEVMSSGP